ncbi:glycosyltransferase family 25 protein [Nitratireductor sp. XY-223]|uniref:glycosyltransferase family 25 protein n=1 Tax=Nitratireductor sp. XY-223 TaxID=2561926 RepID=UPI0010AADD4D|nr:glycosyltransferase family 25 protein [Nitratireductor sp. XY-223]
MKTYLINLDRSEDRLSWFMKDAGRLDLDVVRVPAVDGAYLSPAEIDAYQRMKNRGYELGRSDIASYLSHRLVWQRVAESGEPWAFVAEDDIHFSERAAPFFADAGWIPDDADIVKAETFAVPTRISRWSNPKVFDRSISLLHCRHLGAAGYFLSAECAQRLVGWTEDYCELADVILFDEELGIFDRLRIYQLVPAICVQDELVNRPDLSRGLGSVRMDDNILTGVHIPEPDRPKRSIGRKIQRELVRPFERLARFFVMLATGQKMMRVPFR